VRLQNDPYPRDSQEALKSQESIRGCTFLEANFFADSRLGSWAKVVVVTKHASWDSSKQSS
jgi:hypothetical protein